jgi:hypothetical protein
MNVERGFFRLTAVVSALILLAGLGLAFFEWKNNREAWATALAPSDAELVKVFVSGLGMPVTFPASTPRSEMMNGLPVLEQTGFRLLGQSAKKTYPGSYDDIGDEDLGRKIAAKGSEAIAALMPSYGYDAASEKGRWIDYIYIGQRGNKPARLYSREEILRTWDELAADTPHGIPGDVDGDAFMLSIAHRLPDDVPSPPGRVLAKGLGLAVGAAAVPWVLFFILRWIVRGFRSA